MRRFLLVSLTTTALLLSSAAPPRAQSPARASRRPAARERVPRIVAANLFDKLYFKERAESEISPAALAAYGNALVARRGLDHIFDACAVVKANPRPRPVPGATEETKAFAYTLRRVGGGRVSFQLITDVYGEPATLACGECSFEVPALRVTKREMLVVSEGRRYRLERPPNFLLSEVSLVDASLRAVVRTWQLPYLATPLGLSPDRAKLYLPLPNFDDVEWDDKLAVEISDAGVRFVVRAGLSLPKSEAITGAPESEDDVSFIRFGTGKQSYVLRSTNPCT